MKDETAIQKLENKIYQLIGIATYTARNTGDPGVAVFAQSSVHELSELIPLIRDIKHEYACETIELLERAGEQEGDESRLVNESAKVEDK